MPRLQEIVDSLPRDNQQLHDLLLKNKCHGVPRHANGCPISKYLTKITGNNVCVGVCTCMYRNSTSARKGNTVHIPPDIQTFIHNFDLGKYPDLIEK